MYCWSSDDYVKCKFDFDHHELGIVTYPILFWANRNVHDYHQKCSNVHETVNGPAP